MKQRRIPTAVVRYQYLRGPNFHVKTLLCVAVAIMPLCVAGANGQKMKIETIDYPPSAVAALHYVPPQVGGTTVPLRGVQTRFMGINDKGIVVGTLILNILTERGVGVGLEHGFFYANGKFTLLDGPLTGPNWTEGVAINNRDQVLIRQTAQDGFHYFIYNMTAKTFTPMSVSGQTIVNNTAVKITLSTVTGFNDNGEISGFIDNNAGFYGAPTLGVSGSLTASAGDAKFTMIRCPNNGPMQIGGMNNADVVTGICSLSIGFIAKGAAVTLFSDPKTKNTQPKAINDQNVITGSEALPGRIDGGFTYDGSQFSYLNINVEGPQPTVIQGTPPWLYPQGINNKGVVVGRAERQGGSAFIATPQP
jgi:hypothetical protein